MNVDAPELTVARYAARVSLWAFSVSALSLCVAFAAFVLELRRWFSEGVRLSMSVMSDAIFVGGGLEDKKKYIAITVRNRGDAATTITHMVLYNYPSRLAVWLPKRPRFMVRLLKKYQPATFIVNTTDMPPPYVLEPGRNWHGMAAHTPELEAMIKAGRLFVGVIGSHSDKPRLMRVRRWTPPKNTKAA
ncbi:hypothetical protein ACOSOMT5_P3132 [Acidiphilium sp. MT5]